MVALETPTPFLGMGAGEEVNSVKGAARLGNSQSKEEGTGEGGREQRSEEGRKGGREWDEGGRWQLLTEISTF